jgi:hypothetical protein
LTTSSDLAALGLEGLPGEEDLPGLRLLLLALRALLPTVLVPKVDAAAAAVANKPGAVPGRLLLPATAGSTLYPALWALVEGTLWV